MFVVFFYPQHEGVHMRMPPMGVQGFDSRSLDMSPSFGFARERRLQDVPQFHHDGLRLENSAQNHQNHRAAQNNHNEDSSHLDGASGGPALLDGVGSQHQDGHRDGSSHQTPPQHQPPQDQDVTVIGAGADVDDLELSQSSNSLVLSPEVTLEEPSSSERRILPVSIARASLQRARRSRVELTLLCTKCMMCVPAAQCEG